MTLQEAYIKAKDAAKEDGLTLLTGCNDHGDVWGFEFMPPNFDRKDPNTWIGGGYDVTVDKKNGELGKYNPFVDGFDMLDNAKSIPLNEIGGLIQPIAKTKQNRAQEVTVASHAVPA